MNKKMRDILAQIKTKTAQARAFQDDGKTEDAAKLLSEINNLQKEYNNEKQLYEMEKNNVPNEPKPADKTDGFAVMAKVARGIPLTEAENAMITSDDPETDTENLLVPEDVNLEINELRKSYISAKSYVNVITTNTLSGSFLFEKNAPTGLDDFSDGSDITEMTKPTFENKKWAIGWKGNIIPVSNILLGAEKAGLMSYLNRLFVKKAIISENTDIFDALKTGKSSSDIAGLAALKKKMNTELDPSCMVNGIIITNQTGFNFMDEETDAVGRPLLNINPANPTQKMFNGLPIVVFADSLLPNSSSKAPIFFGDINAGVTFIEKQGLQFATSEHVFFNKNQLGIRIIEGYDVIQADKDAYGYGLLTAAPAKTVSTKAST